VAGERDVLLVDRQLVTGGHQQLQLDQVETGHQLGHRVLDLEAGVHLQEVGLARVGVEQELDGAGVDVADLPGQRHRRPGDLAAHLGGDRRGRRLLDHLLVPALGRAVALEEVDDVAVGVGQHLDLDVPAALDVLLHQDGVVTEGGERLPLGRRDGLAELLGGAHDAHPLAPAAGRGLDEHRIVGGQDRTGVRHGPGVGDRRPAGHDGDAGGDGDLAGGVLAAHLLHDRRRRPHQADPRRLDLSGEGGALGEEAVARVDRVGTGLAGRGDHRLDVEVARDPHRLVGRVHVRGLGIEVGEHRDRVDAEPAAGAHHPEGDLATVGDQD
jgi:hypothetical protein